MTFLPFILLSITILSLWFTKKPWVYGPLLGLAIAVGLFTDVFSFNALFFLALLLALWGLYLKRLNPILFLVIVFYTIIFKSHLIPGFNNLRIDSRLFLNFDSILAGILPLIFVTPLARKLRDWRPVFTKGMLISFLGIGIMMILAVASGTVKFQFKLPSHPFLRYFNNLIFVSILEEAFYRGFIQNKLIDWMRRVPYNKYIALILTSLVFTFAHWFWSPNIGTFAFIFLAGLLYGYVYIATKRIESAILCHFLLNFIHMTFFTYHAM